MTLDSVSTHTTNITPSPSHSSTALPSIKQATIVKPLAPHSTNAPLLHHQSTASPLASPPSFIILHPSSKQAPHPTSFTKQPSASLSSEQAIRFQICTKQIRFIPLVLFAAIMLPSDRSTTTNHTFRFAKLFILPNTLLHLLGFWDRLFSPVRKKERRKREWEIANPCV